MKSWWFYICYKTDTSKLLMLDNNFCYVLMNTAGKNKNKQTKANKWKSISSKQKNKNGQSKTVLQTVAWRFLGLAGKLTSSLAECLDSMNSIVFVCWFWWGHNIAFCILYKHIMGVPFPNWAKTKFIREKALLVKCVLFANWMTSSSI